MQKQLHAIIHGRVQGVSFRYYTRLMAQQLKLVGWVRNQPDGTVEVVAVGDQVTLNEFVQFLRTGSPAAHVTAVDIEWQTATDSFDSFTIQ